MINSKQKGSRYEREIASQLKEYGYDARRTAQYCGKSGDAADVEGLKGIHIECKFCQQIKIYDWMAQATRDSEGTGNIPTVWFRKNHCETLVCMKMSDFLELYGETERGQKNGKI